MTQPTEKEYEELDIAVARAEIAAGAPAIRLGDAGRAAVLGADGTTWEPFRPTTSWSHAGPIIEREGIELRPLVLRGSPISWSASCHAAGSEGLSPLVAAMRAYTAWAARPSKR